MEWLAQNWVWVVVFVLFIGMHLFGHGGHGGHGKGGGHGGCCGGGEAKPPTVGEQTGEKRPQAHQH